MNIFLIIYIISVVFTTIVLFSGTYDILRRLKENIDPAIMKAIHRRRGNSVSKNILNTLQIIIFVGFFPINILLALYIIFAENALNNTYNNMYSKYEEDAKKFGIVFEKNNKTDDYNTAMDILDNVKHIRDL